MKDDRAQPHQVDDAGVRTINWGENVLPMTFDKVPSVTSTLTVARPTYWGQSTPSTQFRSLVSSLRGAYLFIVHQVRST